MSENLLNNNKKNIEKRKHARVTINLPIKYRLLNKDKPAKNVYSINISAGGTRMALYVDEPVVVGDLIELSLYIPSKMEPIKAISEVKWVREYYGELKKGFEVGMEYKSISEEDKKSIMKFVNEGL